MTPYISVPLWDLAHMHYGLFDWLEFNGSNVSVSDFSVRYRAWLELRDGIYWDCDYICCSFNQVIFFPAEQTDLYDSV